VIIILLSFRRHTLTPLSSIDIISLTPYRCRFAAISRRLRHAAAAAI
jgi:hypothetical protein